MSPTSKPGILFSRPFIVRASVALILALVCAVFVWLVLLPGGNVNMADGNGASHVERIKRLNPEQYRNSIRDIFGEGIEIDGNFVEAGQREGGLLAVGDAQSGISAYGFESLEKLARNLASQVVSERLRHELLPCKPSSEAAFDRKCAGQFIDSVGYLLYRRPLQDTEHQNLLQLAETSANGNFYAGLEKSLTRMLVSPNFLFRIERTVPDPDADDAYRLTAYSKASRLSFLLWNSSPDKKLLQSAEQGELNSQSGLERQVQRLLDSPRLEEGVRAFFSDMLAFDEFHSLRKDPIIYPQFSHQTSLDAKEQTLRTLTDHLLARNGDYRDLFTTPNTFLTPNLAALLDVPLVQRRLIGRPDTWAPYTYAGDDPRAGLLAQPSFVALHSHPGRTSPTLRGKALRQNLLCQEVPAPPPNVDFKIVNDVSNPDYKTTRQRLSAHATNPTCAGCHKITDPIGLALEVFDGDGQYRTYENGIAIDTSGEMDGVPFTDYQDLRTALHDNPAVVSCVVNRLFSYGSGRKVTARDRRGLKSLRKNFAKQGYHLPELLRALATSELFFREAAPVVEPKDEEHVASR